MRNVLQWRLQWKMRNGEREVLKKGLPGILLRVLLQALDRMVGKRDGRKYPEFGATGGSGFPSSKIRFGLKFRS